MSKKPDKPKKRVTNQPYLDSLFNAAVECTGQDMPGNWEWKGRAHLDGTCKHKKQPTP